MVVGAKVCDLTEDLLWFVCGLYVGTLISSLMLSEGNYRYSLNQALQLFVPSLPGVGAVPGQFGNFCE